jgi:hypothetical protein
MAASRRLRVRGGVAAIVFQVVEERENGLRVQGTELELIDLAALAAGQEREQQAEGIAVSSEGVHTEVTLRREVFGEVPLQQPGQFISLHGERGGSRERAYRPSAVRRDRWRHTTRWS